MQKETLGKDAGSGACWCSKNNGQLAIVVWPTRTGMCYQQGQQLRLHQWLQHTAHPGY